ncbi:type I-E CRISPR-associated protein Cas6/Cse3/CasE [Streptomyces lavendulae]|uniref:type I-E CRISPR-associated protein Cas6/Cse3/CasE n=1 Tax=Streptomyces lavendulae TaxID=1914 RepID=UPI0025568B6C|nr:type I-E CRISPR-associated protein Cas6/Cse3/CasE [Streptomyces lavendulae]
MDRRPDRRIIHDPTHGWPSGKPASETVREARVAPTNPDHVKKLFLRRLQAEGDGRRRRRRRPHRSQRRTGRPENSHAAHRLQRRPAQSPAHRPGRNPRYLVITDLYALVTTLANGIGHARARAYSCGLLLTR